MNESHLQATAGRTASASNDSTPGSISGALTGKGKIPPPKYPGLGQIRGNPKKSSYKEYNGREQLLKNKLQY